MTNKPMRKCRGKTQVCLERLRNSVNYGIAFKERNEYQRGSLEEHPVVKARIIKTTK